MTDQLALDVEPPPAQRRRLCCDSRAPELHERATAETPFPHTAECTNSALGTFLHRETGMIMRALHCIRADGTCPTGGVCLPREGVFDPFEGRCCIELRGGAPAA